MSAVKQLNERVAQMQKNGFKGVGLFVGRNEDATEDDLARGAMEHLDAMTDANFTATAEIL